MADDVLERDIEAIRSWAAGKPIIIRVWIFGSRVRGTHCPDSDLDVAVEHDVLPGDENAFTTGFFERRNWEADLQTRTRLKIHLEPYIPGVHKRVGKGIKRSSRLIYEREST